MKTRSYLQEWLAQAEKHGTWKEHGEELVRLRETVEEQIYAMLDKDQQKQYKDLLKKQERQLAMPRF